MDLSIGNHFANSATIAISRFNCISIPLCFKRVLFNVKRRYICVPFQHFSFCSHTTTLYTYVSLSKSNTMNSILVTTALAALATALPSGDNFSSRRDISSCPLYLPEHNYEFPHLIVPVNDSNVALGNSYFPSISPNDCATIFNFDIPSSRAGQQCSVHFSFPRHDQLATSDFKWNGTNGSSEAQGTLSFYQYAYNTGATKSTTGYSQPPPGPDSAINVPAIHPGNSYKIWSGNCGAGGVMSWKISSPDSWLYYFQDWNACAFGLWILYEAEPPAQGAPCGVCPSPGHKA